MAQFILIAVITFLGFLDTSLLLPVMSLYASDVGAGVGVAGLIIGLYSITNTPASVGFGRVIDRIGYKTPLIIGLAGDMVAIFLYSLVSSPLQLGILRAWHGISGGLIGPASMYAVASLASAKGRGKAMGIYGMAMAFAMLVGFGLGGAIQSRFSYQALFWAGSGMVGLAVVLTAFLPHQQPTNPPQSLPYQVRDRLFSKGGGSTGRGLPIVPSMPEANRRTSIRVLLRKRGLITAYACIFAQYFTFGSVVTLLPLHVRSLNLEAFHFGMMMSAFAIVFIIMQLRSGYISDRVGRFVPTVLGLSVAAVAVFALPLLTSFPLLLTAMAFYGVAFGLLFPSVSALVADNTEPHERGTGTGIFHAMLTAGVAIGAPVMGWLGEIIGLKYGLMVTPVVFLLALVVTVGALGKRRP